MKELWTDIFQAHLDIHVFAILECFFDSVLNFPIPDGRSGQQMVDMIQKKLETLGAEKTGNFAVDSETYQSQSRM